MKHVVMAFQKCFISKYENIKKVGIIQGLEKL